MTILLLDDDPFVLEGLQKRGEWERLGLDTVLTASNASQARALWAPGQIDILLSDIEMPSESGLAFTEWLREQGDAVQVAYLTSYADFSYAQQAIALGSQRYFLKPIDYKQLADGLASMITQARERRSAEEQGRYWLSNRDMVTEHFWMRLLTQGTDAFTPDLLSACRLMGLPYREESRFIPLCLLPSHSPRMATAGNRHVLFRDVTALCRRTFEGQGFCFHTLLMLTDDVWTLLLCVDDDSFSILQIERMSRKLLGEAGRALQQTLRIGLGKASTLRNIRDIVEQLRSLLISCDTDLVRLHDARYMERDFQAELIESWISALNGGDWQALKLAVCARADHAQTDAERMALRDELIWRMDAVFSHRGMEACFYFTDEISETLRRHAADSPAALQRYATHMIEKAVEYLGDASSPDALVKRLTRRINEQYAQAITRNDLAEMVCLNPDYMARLFKRETGMSVNAYLLERRLEAAKELLERTAMPVSAVSMQVGYENFAYFSKMFREKTGQTPNEYRKKRRGTVE